MVDVIMPAYNSHDTIMQSLFSLAIQTYKDRLNVYIIDDNSDVDFKKEVEFFSPMLNIQTLRLEQNGGPGVARQYGIDHSKGEYILFLDSDDLLCDCFAIENLVNNMAGNDIVLGVMIDEVDDGNYIINYESDWCLHGKLYRRSLLEENNLRFNNTRKSEDDAFHKLCLIAAKNVVYIGSNIYLYKNNKNSIVNSVDDYWFYSLNDYVNNMEWCIKMAEERNFDKSKIAYHVHNVFLFTYKVYTQYMDRIDAYKLLNISKKIYLLNIEYEPLLAPEIKSRLHKDFMACMTERIPLSEYKKLYQNMLA